MIYDVEIIYNEWGVNLIGFTNPCSLYIENDLKACSYVYLFVQLGLIVLGQGVYFSIITSYTPAITNCTSTTIRKRLKHSLLYRCFRRRRRGRKRRRVRRDKMQKITLLEIFLNKFRIFQRNFFRTYIM